MKNLTEFQARSAAAGAAKMLGGKYFDICQLHALSKIMGREAYTAGKDYAALQTLHCMDWAEMGPDLARLTREKCLEILALPPQTVEVAVHAAEAESSKPGLWQRLLGG